MKGHKKNLKQTGCKGGSCHFLVTILITVPATVFVYFYCFNPLTNKYKRLS